MRFAVGLEVRVAQSNGEWPGVSSTFLRGFAGMDVCLGGGARPEEGGPRFGIDAWRVEMLLDPSMERRGGWRCGAGLGRGGMRPGPAPARCTELIAGKDGTE